jgi:hypothetical protein
MEFLSILPHTIQTAISGTEGNVWGILRDDNLVGPSSDLMLKHGATIQGEWNVVGVIDALPESMNLGEFGTDVPVDEDFNFEESGLGGFVDVILPIAKLLLGRPDTAFGITPMLIFREVTTVT